MKMLNSKALACLCMIFFVVFCKTVVIEASSDLVTEIAIFGTGATKANSLTNGFIELTKRRDTGDIIVINLLQTMPYHNFPQKEAVIAAYNAKLKEKLREQEFAERERQRAIEIAEKEKQQAQLLSKAADLEEEHHTLESVKNALQAEHYAFGGGDSSSLTITDTLAAPHQEKGTN